MEKKNGKKKILKKTAKSLEIMSTLVDGIAQTLKRVAENLEEEEENNNENQEKEE